MAHGDAVTVWDDSGQPRLDRVVQPQPTLADELQGDGSDERLRDAARPEPAVDRHRPRPAQFGYAAGAPPHAMLVTHLRQRAHRAGGHDVVQPSCSPVRQPVRPSSGVAVAAAGAAITANAVVAVTSARCTRFIPTSL